MPFCLATILSRYQSPVCDRVCWPVTTRCLVIEMVGALPALVMLSMLRYRRGQCTVSGKFPSTAAVTAPLMSDYHQHDNSV